MMFPSCVVHISPTFVKADVVPFPWSKDASQERACFKQTDQSVAALTTNPVTNPEQRGLSTGPTPPKTAFDPKLHGIKSIRPSGISTHLAESSNTFLEIHAECEKLGNISFKVSSVGAVAGKVLQHASRELERLFQKEAPLIFKIGYTHNPSWRWANRMYGYAHARDGWTNMLILHIAKEPWGPAMLEAALIDKYQSCLTAKKRREVDER